MLPEAALFPVVSIERISSEIKVMKKLIYQLTISHDIPWTCLMSSTTWCQVHTKKFTQTDFLTMRVIEHWKKEVWEI